MKKFMMLLIIAMMALVGCSDHSDLTGNGQEPPVTTKPTTVTPTPNANTQVDSMQALHATTSIAVSDLDAFVTHGNNICPGITQVIAQGISFHPTAPYPYLSQVVFHVIGDGVDTSFVYTTKDKSAAPTDWLEITGTIPIPGSDDFPAKGGLVTATFSEAILTLGTVTATAGTTQYSLEVDLHPDTLEKVLVKFPELPPDVEISVKFTGFEDIYGHAMASPHIMTVKSEKYVPFMLPEDYRGFTPLIDHQGRLLITGSTEINAGTYSFIARFNSYGYLDSLITMPTIIGGGEAVITTDGHLHLATKADGQPQYVREFDLKLEMVNTYYVLDPPLMRLVTVGNDVFAIGGYENSLGEGKGYVKNVKTSQLVEFDYYPMGIFATSDNHLLLGSFLKANFSIHVTTKLSLSLNTVWEKHWQNPDGNLAAVQMSLPVEYNGNYRLHTLFNGTTHKHVVFDYDYDGGELVANLHEPVNMFDIKPCATNGYVLVPGLNWRKGYKRVAVDAVRGWYIMTNHSEDIDVFKISDLSQID